MVSHSLPRTRCLESRRLGPRSLDESMLRGETGLYPRTYPLVFVSSWQEKGCCTAPWLIQAGDAQQRSYKGHD